MELFSKTTFHCFFNYFRNLEMTSWLATGKKKKLLHPTFKSIRLEDASKLPSTIKLLGNNSVFQLLELLINEPKDFISR
jgi:hypothetical protein